MPFYTPSYKPEFQIDYNKYKHITVMSYTDFNGNIKPMLFKYESEDETILTINIDSIIMTKDINGGISFNCLITNYGRQQRVTLVYFYRQHTWYLCK